MDSSARRFGARNRLRVSIGLALIVALAGCARAIQVGDKCEGLEHIGYKPPVSQQDWDDIKALGFDKCAEYLEENNLIQ